MSGRSFRRRPSPATVVASIALLVALGGTSVAAVSIIIPKASVGTAQLKKDAVVSSKVKDGSLLSADFKAGKVPAGPAGPAGQAGAQGPAGPSDAYSKLLDGPVAVPITHHAQDP